MRRVMEQGDFRPMAHNRDAMTDLVAILKAREADYGRAHARIETSGKSVEGCVAELVGVTKKLISARPRESGDPEPQERTGFPLSRE
jgi:XRE family aerobic/anaerobic benzoate catabolism transcriptional regulator